MILGPIRESLTWPRGLARIRLRLGVSSGSEGPPKALGLRLGAWYGLNRLSGLGLRARMVQGWVCRDLQAGFFFGDSQELEAHAVFPLDAMGGVAAHSATGATV